MWWRCCWLGNIRALDAVVHTHHAFHGIHKCFSHSTNYIWYMIWNFARQHFTEIYTLSSGGHKYVFFYINIVNNSNKILSSQRYVFFEVCAVKSKVINQPPPTHTRLSDLWKWWHGTGGKGWCFQWAVLGQSYTYMKKYTDPITQ